VTSVSSSASAKRLTVSPIARKLAAELGVDPVRVSGSGPGGRITRDDVERAAKASAGAPRAEEEAVGASAPSASSPTSPAFANNAAASDTAPESIPFRGMRRTIAARMHQSLRDTAQLTLTTEADVSAAVEMRERLKHEFDFTFTDMLIHAAARALLRHPRMNSRANEDAITLLPVAHVGMAVALDEGLIVPVVHNASALSLRQIASTTKDFGERARVNKLKLEDVSGGTFTITNLGTWGIDAFTPILNNGETGILGVGRIVEKPAVYRGEIMRRSMLTLNLTFDHRVIDGAPAAAFLQTVVDIFNYGDR
jgi:pyruvate dehydrogenase E2 component (dihydrolipoamide acetyltransferase)